MSASCSFGKSPSTIVVENIVNHCELNIPEVLDLRTVCKLFKEIIDQSEFIIFKRDPFSTQKVKNNENEYKLLNSVKKNRESKLNGLNSEAINSYLIIAARKGSVFAINFLLKLKKRDLTPLFNPDEFHLALLESKTIEIACLLHKSIKKDSSSKNALLIDENHSKLEKTIAYKVFGVIKPPQIEETMTSEFDDLLTLMIEHGRSQIIKDYLDANKKVPNDHLLKLFEAAIKFNQKEIFDLLLKDLPPESEIIQDIFRVCSECGRTKMLSELLKKKQLDEFKNWGKCFDIILNQFDSAESKFFHFGWEFHNPLEEASILEKRKADRNKYMELIEYLYQNTNIVSLMGENKALKELCSFKSFTNPVSPLVINLLKNPLIEVSEDDNQLLRYACENGSLELINLLFQDPKLERSGKGYDQAIQFANESIKTEKNPQILKDYKEILRILKENKSKDSIGTRIQRRFSFSKKYKGLD